MHEVQRESVDIRGTGSNAAALANDAASLSAQQHALQSAGAALSLTRQAYAAGNAGYVQVLGEVQANSPRYVDAPKLLLAAGGRVKLDAGNDDTHQ